MKKETEVRYQNSANLFQFCRRVLDHKFGGIRVIDQDVGQILGFDPADCSHWKKGKKNIRSIQAMKSIAEHLGVDEKLVVDIASGEIDDNEAFYEFGGYGAFDFDAKILDAARKDFYRKHAGTWTREKELELKNQFDAQESRIAEIVKQIHEKIQFEEAPLYLPEVAAAYPEIRLAAEDEALREEEAKEKVLATQTGDGVEIRYPAGRDARPYMRFRIAKEIGRHFLRVNGLQPPKELGAHADHISDVQSNLFAAMLLTPANLIRKEMTQINVSKDVVNQLSEVFWVSKGFMNGRLRDIIAGQSAI